MAERMKILIAYDGSDCSRAAVDDLTRAGLPADAEALVLSVAEVWTPPDAAFEPWPESFEEWTELAVAEAQGRALFARDRVGAAFPAWDVAAESCFGGPAEEILQRAESWGPDLIVVGSHGRSALGRLLLGSVSQSVVLHADCSVRVVRDGAGPHAGPLRLVLGVKGAPSSDEAIRAVARRAWPEGSQARLVTAFGPYRAFGATLASVIERIRGFHAEAADLLGGHGLDVESSLVEADPKRAIVVAAEEWGADAIFVGTRDLNLRGRIRLGSVSTAVVHRARCTVEVVREQS